MICLIMIQTHSTPKRIKWAATTFLLQLRIIIKADLLRSSGKGPNSSNKNDNTQTKTIAEQTIQAALQFGVLVGVALMVGILFMLNVGADLLYTAICDKYTSAFSKHKPVDIEDQDPASLVGSFKRYK